MRPFLELLCLEDDVPEEVITESLGLDRRYLSRIFKESMGISVQDYLIRVRLEQAQKLLAEGTSVKMTSQLVGYTDCFNFSKMFKSITPSVPSITQG